MPGTAPGEPECTHYEHVPPARVRLAFFGAGREGIHGGRGGLGELVCLDEQSPDAGALCCAGGDGAACRVSGELEVARAGAV